MKKIIKNYWAIILILIIAAFLRFYKLNTYPALNADEAAIGYNAYSLIKTGQDEHGNPWPIQFQSFNDYKPGLYFYMVLPLVKFLGLNEWSVRIPNAILAVATIYIVYLLIKELFEEKRLALFSSLFLSISPWHIHFSRGGWEVNVATFFISLGMLLILKGIKKGSVILFISAFSAFIFSLYAYHAARIISPLLIGGIAIIYRNDIFIRKNIKPLLVSTFFGFLLLIPLFGDLVSGDVFARAAGVGLFADKGPINRINEQRGEHNNVSDLSAKLLHNKPINYGLAFLSNWTSHFTGEFLFLTGDDIQRNKVPETGQMYLFDILLLSIGFFAISRGLSKGWKLILWWLLMAPVAAALTFQAPHALRAQNMVIPLVIISAYGFSLLTHIKARPALYVILLLMVWNIGRYFEMYYFHMSKMYPYSSQYGVKELVAYLIDNEGKYKDVVVTNRYDQPYILVLFYLKYPPEKFQVSHTLSSRDEYGFSTVEDFDNYHFASVDFDSLKPQYPGSYIIGTPEEIPNEANVIKKIYGENGFEYFDIVAN